MSKMIGQSLVEQGLINQQQLEKGLSAQLIYGGHLGTSLIELGFVTEEELGAALSGIFGVDHADPRAFLGLPAAVIRAIPRQLVEQHLAIPISKHEGTVRVAMVDPRDLQALDDLAFGSGCRIEPCISPEIRIRHAMDAYYGIERSRRFLTLSALIDEVHLLQERVAMANARQTAVTGEAGVAKAGLSPAAIAPPEFDFDTDAAAPPHPEPLERLADHLCAADNKEMLARAVLDHAVLGADRCLLFMVKDCTVQLWDWIGFEIAPEAATPLDFELTAEPLFSLLAGNEWFRGPVPDEARFRRLYERLQIDTPAELLLLPVRLNDRLVAIFYCDGGQGGAIGAETEDCRALVRKLQIAMHIVALKNRIRG